MSRGSWLWALRIAERTVFIALAALFVTIHAADLDSSTYRRSVALVGILVVLSTVLFRSVLPTLRHDPRGAWLGVLSGAVASSVIFAVLKGQVPSVALFFVPPIVVAGLLGNLFFAVTSAVLAVAGYLGVAFAIGSPPRLVAALLNSTVFLLSGVVSGVLAQELRRHVKREAEEHALAVAVGHRLTAVVGSIEEGIVFSNREGMVRMINRRAAELFELDPDEYVDAPTVQLLRVVARATEDPENFMETFQELRDDPEKELRWDVEQIIPARRMLRVLSRPVRSNLGRLVGRIDVYTDVTEEIRRAEELKAAFDEARKTAESYQRGFLPKSVPALPRVGLVSHYVAAAGDRAVCGDFYDFVSLADGRVGLLIGDVCGIGPEAVNDAALTRYTLRSLSQQITDPAELLSAVNSQVFDFLPPDRFVRLVYGVLDPERAILEYTNAGHVPPMLFRIRRGGIERLEEGGLPLGIESDQRFKTGHLELDPGDMLLFYTDGATEAPRLGKPLGQGRFSDLVRQYGVGTPGELIQAIRRAVDGWVDAELRDDIAMLACQVVPDTAVDTSARELVLPNDPSRLRDARTFVRDFLTDLRVPVDVSAEVTLAASEAIGNAIKYGRRPEGRSEIRVRCHLQGTDVHVVIADDGPGFEAPEGATSLPDPFASGGRGLFLMQQLTDAITVDSRPGGTTVGLVRRAFDEPPLPPGHSAYD